MTHRSDRIWLAPSEPRCEPTKKMGDCDRCKRYLAEIPPMGSLTDFSLSIPLYVTWCANRLTLGAAPAEPAKKEVKPWPSL